MTAPAVPLATATAPDAAVGVTVLLFASYADALGAPSVALALEPGATAGDALARVRAMAAERAASRGGRPLPPARVAVNERYAGEGTVLRSGDVVAVIPPIAGG